MSSTRCGVRSPPAAVPMRHRSIACAWRGSPNCAAALLFVLLDGPADERLAPAEADFLARYADRQPVLLCAPEPPLAPVVSPLAADAGRGMAGGGPVGGLRDSLSAGTPPAHDPLIDRARRLRETLWRAADQTPAIGAGGREAEAELAAAQVCAWLTDGVRRIALIAEDRLSARRVRVAGAPAGPGQRRKRLETEYHARRRHDRCAARNGGRQCLSP